MGGETRTVTVEATEGSDDASPRGSSPPLLRVGLEVRDHALPEATRVARFAIVRKLGEGGMGIVYAAYDDELDRKIAIKLVRASVGDAHARAQTLREAKAMARLSHPNVVQVYEVGEYEGQVFLAMEYVRGETLRTWLAQRDRAWQEIVAMFRQCGAGLVAAHEAGLVHRDFKPDNTLIGEDGRARVLDFGLARAWEPDATSQPNDPATGDPARTGRILGTPAYMAPEQHVGGSTDARTDQFSFCVALWEALHGTRPFAGTTRSELARAVSSGRLREPPRDSTVPTWLRRVIERGLAVDPADRWPSMTALLEQLARDPRRTRFQLAAGVALVALLVAVVVFASRQTSESRSPCAGGRERLADIWDGARADAVRRAFRATGAPYAEDSWRGVQRLLDDYADAWVDTYTEACTAHHRGEQSGALLDLRMSCLDQRRGELGSLVDVYLDADVGVVENAVRGAGGLPPTARCSDRETLTAELAPPAELAVATRVKAVREDLARAAADIGTGRFVAGRTLARAAVDEAEAIGYRPLEAEALLCLGRLHEQAGEPADAEHWLERAYWAAEATRHDTTRAEAVALLITVVGVRLARAADVQRWVRLGQALVARLGPGGETEAALAHNLGALARHQGDPVAALAHYQRSLELYSRLRDAEHPLVASARNNIGAVLATTRRPLEALEQFEHARALLEASLGPRHPLFGDVLINIGNVHYTLGALELAAEHHELALALYDALGPGHPNVAAANNNLATIHMARGDWDLARNHLEVALALRERERALDHPDLAPLLNNLATVYLGEGSLADASRYFESARAILELRLGARSPSLFFPLAGLGRVALARDRPRVAAALLAEALALGDPALSDSELADARFALARARARLGDTSPATLDLARRARDSYQIGGAHRLDALADVDHWLRAAPLHGP